MSNPRRRWPLVVLVGSGLVGLALVVTGGEGGLELEKVVTIDGIETDVPLGWEPMAELPFEYRPPPEMSRPTDRWLVAWVCDPAGCESRTSEQWLELGERLPTFSRARADEGELLFDLEEIADHSSRVLTGRTAAGEVQVFVAVFHDGADHYVECGLSVFDDTEGLAAAIVEACQSATPPP